MDEGAGWVGRRICIAVCHPVLTTAQALLDTQPPLYVLMVEREGMTIELTFISHDWEEGEWRGNMVRGAILNSSFHKKSKGVTEKSKGVTEKSKGVTEKSKGVTTD